MSATGIGGITFHFRFYAEAPAPVLVIANVLGTNLQSWEPPIPRFSERLHALRYDARGMNCPEPLTDAVLDLLTGYKGGK